MAIKKTKRILLGVIVLLSFLVFIQACEKSNPMGSEATITLPENETKTVVLESNSIAITASNFNESRCPIDVNCVWQGYAIVNVNFKDGIKEQNIPMCIGGCEILSIGLPKTIVLDGKTYKIQLKEITPYPNSSKVTTEPSKAKITISE